MGERTLDELDSEEGMKEKTCAICRIKFVPSRAMQKVCSPSCAYEYSRKQAVKAEMVQALADRKTVKAQQMKQHLSLPVSAQEREAYASEEMQNTDKAIQAAQEEETRLYWLLTAAQIKAEAWRTLSANARIEAKVL